MSLVVMNVVDGTEGKAFWRACSSSAISMGGPASSTIKMTWREAKVAGKGRRKKKNGEGVNSESVIKGERRNNLANS